MLKEGLWLPSLSTEWYIALCSSSRFSTVLTWVSLEQIIYCYNWQRNFSTRSIFFTKVVICYFWFDSFCTKIFALSAPLVLSFVGLFLARVRSCERQFSVFFSSCYRFSVGFLRDFVSESREDIKIW